MKRLTLLLMPIGILTLSGCFDAPINVEKIDATANIDSCAVPSSLYEFERAFDSRKFDEMSIAGKRVEFSSLEVARENFQKTVAISPGETNNIANIKGSNITDEAQIALGTIQGRVGDLITVPVKIKSDGFYDEQHYEFGLVALMSDFTITRNQNKLVELVSVARGEATQDWVGLFASAFDIEGFGYGVRFGGYQGNGTPITREMGEVTIGYLTFRVVSAGNSEYHIYTNWDHIWYYQSNSPMPRFNERIHARGCEFYLDLVGIHHNIEYQPPNAHRVLYLSFDHDDVPNFGDFTCDIELPENLEYAGYAGGYAATEFYEIFEVTQEGNILHVNAQVGSGYYHDHPWVIIGRIDVRTRNAPMGEVTQIKLTNFGGSLAGASTGCYDHN
jgi:hypothetical protein